MTLLPKGLNPSAANQSLALYGSDAKSLYSESNIFQAILLARSCNTQLLVRPSACHFMCDAVFYHIKNPSISVVAHNSSLEPPSNLLCTTYHHPVRPPCYRTNSTQSIPIISVIPLRVHEIIHSSLLYVEPPSPKPSITHQSLENTPMPPLNPISHRQLVGNCEDL